MGHAYRTGYIMMAMALLGCFFSFQTYAADAPKDNEKGAASEMAPLDIKLPPPYFGGTPLAYSGPHLEESDGLPRKPFSAPKGATVLSEGKPVTSSDTKPTMGKLAMITDGKKGHQNDLLTELGHGPQWVQVDLGEECDLYAIVCWHFLAGERVYFDVVVQTADDADFTKNVRTIYNNDFDNSSKRGVGTDKEYIESYDGRLFSALKDGKGTRGRYVRLYSNGNTSDEMNHYVEVEVWGKSAAK